MNRAREERTPDKGLYEEAQPERGSLFRLQVYQRVGNSRVELLERVIKSIILVSYKVPLIG